MSDLPFPMPPMPTTPIQTPQERLESLRPAFQTPVDMVYEEISIAEALLQHATYSTREGLAETSVKSGSPSDEIYFKLVDELLGRLDSKLEQQKNEADALLSRLLAA